ncbi:MAG: threonine/serine exporter family protein [Treponemataceae bacterium]
MLCDSNRLIDIAVRAGRIVLENGGETYRAEDIIVYVAKSLGAINPSAFVTPTVILFSFEDVNRNHFSTVKRISSRGVNLRKVAQVNALSFRLVKRSRTVSPLLIENLLNKIDSSGSYKNRTILIHAAGVSFFFVFLFGGKLREAVVALVIGVLLRLSLFAIAKIPLGNFIIFFVLGTIISVLSEFAVFIHVISSPIIVTTAVLMQVVPGLAMVNGIRDIIAGDLISGIARLVEACIIAVALSVGSIIGFYLFGSIF